MRSKGNFWYVLSSSPTIPYKSSNSIAIPIVRIHCMGSPIILVFYKHIFKCSSSQWIQTKFCWFLFDICSICFKIYGVKVFVPSRNILVANQLKIIFFFVCFLFFLSVLDGIFGYGRERMENHRHRVTL